MDSSTFVSEFVTPSKEQYMVHSMRYKLMIMGVKIDGEDNVF